MLLAVLSVASCRTGRDRIVVTRYWLTDPAPGCKSNAVMESFPELSGDLAVPWLTNRADLGVCFSGGGTRSAAATLGQLRGLKHSGLLKHVKYISAVSGGSWAATPFVYLPSKLSEAEFLGKYVPPSDLIMVHFDAAHAGPHSLAQAIAHSRLAESWLSAFFSRSGDETYARTLEDVFLKPFGLGDRDRFFSFHPAAVSNVVARAKARMASSRRSKKTSPPFDMSDFHCVERERPYLIVGGTIRRWDLSPWHRDHFHHKGIGKRIPVEFTPLYTGVRNHFVSRSGREDIGGGYIETFAYDSQRPKPGPTTNTFSARIRHGLIFRGRNAFSLSDMIGSSGAAPAVTWWAAKPLGMPEFVHWSPADPTRKPRSREYVHSDGGHVENLGLMPLLARKVGNIIAFVNNRDAFDPTRGYPTECCPDYVAAFFGYDHTGKFQKNQVFERKRYMDLVGNLTSRYLAGEDLVHYDTYTVLPNEYYKVSPYEVKICWILLPGRPVKNSERVVHRKQLRWVREMRDPFVRDMFTDMTSRYAEEFRQFPTIPTFLTDKTKIIDLHIRQVSALAHLTSWTVVQHRNNIRDHLLPLKNN